ncbi:hypothetical protein DM02DRAFT_474733, partial [Periconia macrospinosa]
NDSIAPRLLIPVGIILGIGFIIYVARMYSRIKMNHKLDRDDFAITVAEICSIVGYALVAVSCKYGVGRHTIHVSSEDRSSALFYFFLQATVCYWGVAAMRVSVAFLLLRMMPHSTAWKRILWIMISFQVLVVLFTTVWSVTFCIPPRAFWKNVPGAKCKSTYAARVFGYLYTSIGMSSDLFLSLMPLTFIWHLRRPRVEKVVVGVLMCLGLTATTAAIKRLVDMAYWNYSSSDLLRDLLIPNMWCMLEEVIGVAAVSIPYLKAPME